MESESPKVLDPQDVEQVEQEIIVEQGQVIIHCLFISETGMEAIRIWPSTFLNDHHSDHRSELVHAENISLFPQWTWVKEGRNYFTLIFSGLPGSCTLFDLVENCNGGPGAFRVNDIKRTSQDVYHIRIK